jgi:dihydropteroate synthase
MPKTQIIGIVNITPDSFSDGGVAAVAKQAIDMVYAQFKQGADIVDIGAESTRPGAMPLSHNVEWARLEPILKALRADLLAQNIKISLDSYHAKTIKKAIQNNISIVNDVSGLRDVHICEILADSAVDIISMHALTLPADKGVTLPAEACMGDVLQNWLNDQQEILCKYRINPKRVCFDAGIGFGKNAAQSFAMMQAVMQRDHTQEKWVMGHSRKSCLNIIEQLPADARDSLTRALSALFIQQDIQALRVHDVAGHIALRQALSASRVGSEGAVSL